MSKRRSLPCFDAGSEYCPCILASLGQCVACSMLRGEDTCDCGWSGTCIFDEFIRNGKMPKPARAEVIGTVRERNDIVNTGTSKAFVSRLNVPPFLARGCFFPGSFVMVRPEGTAEAFNVPLSAMEASIEGIIDVAVEVQGPKTTALDQAMQEHSNVIVKGPFWSGLQGLPHLARLGTGTTLIVAKGIGQAAVPQIARYISLRRGQVRVFAGPGTLGKVFITDSLNDIGIPCEILPQVDDHNLEYLKTSVETGAYDFLISAGSQLQHKGILEMLAKVPESLKVPQFLWTSHLTMTCAEGICGSCMVSGFRGCKAKFDRDFESHLLR